MTSDKLRALLDRIAAILQEIRRERLARQAKDAPDFNLFRTLGINENDISRLLAWLLDPKESHGQGNIFLQAFLDKFIVKGSNLSGVLPDASGHVYVGTEETTREQGIAGRRIDIYIELDRDMAIGIENKPWAAYQQHQVSDYLQEIAARARTLRDHRLLVLSRHGSSCEDIPAYAIHEHFLGTVLNKTTVIPYAELANWLGYCGERDQPQKVQYVIDEMKEFFMQDIVGNMPSQKANAIVEEVTQDAAFVEAAFSIFSNEASIKDALMIRLADQLRNRPAISKDFIVECNAGHEEKDKGISFIRRDDIKTSEPKPRIYFGFDLTGYNGAAYGIVNPDDNWAWWKWFSPYKDWYRNPAPWQEIADGHTMAERIERLVIDIDASLAKSE